MFLPLWKKMVMARMTKAAGRPGPARLACERLEARTTPAAQQIIATSVEFGAAPVVHVSDAATGQEKFTVQAYEPSFTGGVRVAVGDVDGDGVEDLIAGAGVGGGAVVKVFSGVDGHLVRSFYAGDESNRGGASVTAADFDGDGRADIVVGAIQNGTELVQVLRGTDGTVLHQFRPFNAPIEGVTVAAGDYNGDGHPDVVVGAGVGGAPRVVVLDGTDGTVLLNTFAFESTARGGVQVAAGDLDGDGRIEVVAAPGPGGGPRVVVLEGGSGGGGTLLHSFFAYDDSSTARNGVQVSVFDVNLDGRNDIVTARGPGQAPDLRAFDGQTLAPLPVPQFPGLPFGSVAAAATDATAPTVVVNALTTNNATPTLTGTVSDPDDATGLSVDVTVGGRTFAATVSGTTWSATVPVPLADGTYDVAVTATDPAGNAGSATLAGGLVIDTVAPVPAVTTAAPDPTAASPIPFTVTFSEAVTGFTAGGVSVSNGSVTGFTPVNATTYTLAVTPAGQGAVSVSVPAGAAADAAGNPSTASNTPTLTFDSVAPVVAADPLTTNNPTPTLTGTVDDPAATVFVTVGGQTFPAPVSGTTWTVTVPTALTEGTYDIQVAATDAAGNTGGITLAGGLVIDTTAPTVSISGPSAAAAAAGPVSFTVTYADAHPLTITLSAADITLNSTGTADGVVSVSGTGNTRTVTVSGITGDGTLGISIAAGTATDAAGNDAPAAGPSATVTVNNAAPAAPVIAGLDPATDTGSSDTDGVTRDPTPAVVGTAEAGAEVEVFADSGAGPVSLGTVTADGSGGWSLTPAGPLADGTYTLTATATGAAGSTSGPSAGFTLVIDTTTPTPTITPAASDPTNASPIPVTVVFDEDVTGFDETGLDVTNGSVSNFARLDPRTYTFDVTPTSDGPVTVAVLAGAATDAAGNGSAPAAFSITADRTAPVPTISAAAADPANQPAIPFTVTFSEDVTGFDDTDLAVTNGMVSDFNPVDGHTYTFHVTPATDGPVTIDIAAGAAVDPAGNPSTAASFSITSDRSAPTITGATIDPVATPDGAYGAGAVIDILVTFAEPVAVDTTGGVPTLALNSGGTAVYVGGSGTDALTFRYVVQAGESSPGLDYTAADALALNGAAIADAAGNAADLTLAAPGPLGASRDIAIDTTAPTVASMTASPSSGAFKEGDSIDITVTFSEPVTLSAGGTLTLTLDTGATVILTQDPVNAAAFTGTYTVGAGENSPALGSVSLSVTGGALRDAAGNDADLTISAAASLAASAAVVIDTTAPAVAADTASTGGLSGTAGDGGGSGVVLVEVSIRDGNGAGAYWDESTQDFTSPTELFFAAADTSAGGDWSTWSYALPPAVTGDFQTTARATDAAGNQGLDLETVTLS